MIISEKYPGCKILLLKIKGSVYIANNKSDTINKKYETVIIKTFSKKRHNYFVKDEKYPFPIPKEMYFINLINDKRICPVILDYFQNDKEFAIVMENLTGQWTDLYSYTQKKRINRCLIRILSNVIRALEALVKKGFIT